MDCSTPGLPVHHQLPELAQTHVHGVSDAIQPSHPLSSPSPPAFNLSQHQGLFKWVSSLQQLAKECQVKSHITINFLINNDAKILHLWALHVSFPFKVHFSSVKFSSFFLSICSSYAVFLGYTSSRNVCSFLFIFFTFFMVGSWYLQTWRRTWVSK